MSELKAQNIIHSYPTSPRPVLKDVSLSIGSGETVAIVGESGCGKTTLGRLMAGLYKPSEGEISFDGTDIWKMRGKTRKDWRRRAQMIHQDPYGSLNPGLTLGSTLSPGLLRNGLANRKNVDEVMIDLLQQVGLDATKAFLNRYPHQLSGGQRQRVSIARAIGMQPDVVVADEVTSMLDVSMRVAILDLLLKFQAERGIGFAFISHDFGVVRYFARGGRIAVMFFGRIVEEGPTDEVIINPAHPYTRMLLESIPIPNPRLARERDQSAERLTVAPAEKGCVFANRCPMVRPVCREAMPPLQQVRDLLPDSTFPHKSACLFPDEVETLTVVKKEHDVDSDTRGEVAGGSGSGDSPAVVVGEAGDSAGVTESAG